MRHHLLRSIAVLALVAAGACSRSSEQPSISDDMKQDLARAGAGEVQMAGSATPRLEIMSASERGERAVPEPKAKAVSRAPSSARGAEAVVRSVRRETPAPAQPQVSEQAVAPAEVRVEESAPEPSPASAGRPRAPLPSTQREPAGGWSSPSTIIRNAPFPINP